MGWVIYLPDDEISRDQSMSVDSLICATYSKCITSRKGCLGTKFTELGLFFNPSKRGMKGVGIESHSRVGQVPILNLTARAWP